MESEHFSHEELACSGGDCAYCGGRNFILPLTVNLLEIARYLADAAIYLSCACRCPVHNKSVGSRLYSWHPRGGAVDVVRIGRYTCATQEGRDKIVEIMTAAGFRCIDETDHIHCDVNHYIKRH